MPMDIRTYRAGSLQEALALVRRDLGPNAAILHTREVRPSPLLAWLPVRRQVEVSASATVIVPSRLARGEEPLPRPAPAAPAVEPPAKQQLRDDVRGQLQELQSMVEDLCRQTRRTGRLELSESLFHLYTDLIDADLGETLARELMERVQQDCSGDELADPMLAKARLTRMIEDEIAIQGPIAPRGPGCHLVALVGPTGVGKTTTIAKLAANFRLREKRRVGLITVDTYRIAAVEQLRTYADIIDLPMRVVSTPREMREAVSSMAEMDLVLLDTAGRSPRDEVKIQELRAFLGEAGANEVHLVLSSVASASALERTVERFAVVGATALILTKLDEASGLGNLLPLLRGGSLPLSYLTNGQNVPDDIQPATRRGVARAVLGIAAELT